MSTLSVSGAARDDRRFVPDLLVGGRESVDAEELLTGGTEPIGTIDLLSGGEEGFGAREVLEPQVKVPEGWDLLEHGEAMASAVELIAA